MNIKTTQKKGQYRLGVGIALFNSKGQVFVAQRLDNPGPAWQMPQGGIDPGEDPLDTAFRELEEEIGTANARVVAQCPEPLLYDLPDDLRGKLWGGKFVGQKQFWYAMAFQGEDSHINLETTHPEFSAWKWVDFDQILDLIVPFKRAMYQQVYEQFSNVSKQLRDRIAP